MLWCWLCNKNWIFQSSCKCVRKVSNDGANTIQKKCGREQKIFRRSWKNLQQCYIIPWRVVNLVIMFGLHDSNYLLWSRSTSGCGSTEGRSPERSQWMLLLRCGRGMFKSQGAGSWKPEAPSLGRCGKATCMQFTVGIVYDIVYDILHCIRYRLCMYDIIYVCNIVYDMRYVISYTI